MIKILFVSAIDHKSMSQNQYPPLWPAYLAAYAKKYFVRDEIRFRYYNKGSLRSAIKKFRPHILGISSVSQNYTFAAKFSKIAKEYDIPVIIGGIHITSIPESLTEEMDVGCIGEGEKTFLELLNHYYENKKFLKEKLHTIKGIVFYRDGKLVKTGRRQPFSSMEQIPIPEFSLIGHRKRGYIYTARGCAYNCVFCICSKYWGDIRYCSAERVLEEIKILYRNGTRKIRFADENFTDNVPRLKAIAHLLISSGLNRKIKFSCWCRANTITEEIVQILKAINVVSVKMGFESGNQRVLDYLKGNVTVADNARAIQLFKKYGLQVNGDFIIGSPDEERAEIMQTYDFIKKMPLDFVEINILTPYPGTPTWDMALKKGYVSTNMDWNKINIKFYDTKRNAIILSEKLSYPELYRIFRRLQILRFLKALRAWPFSPWRWEILTNMFGRFHYNLARMLGNY